MGQGYHFENHTRAVTLSRAGGYWKDGEYDLKEVIENMGWSPSDLIVIQGDYGRCLVYQNGECISHSDVSKEELYEGVPPPGWRLRTEEEIKAEADAEIEAELKGEYREERPCHGDTMVENENSFDSRTWQNKYWCDFRKQVRDEKYAPGEWDKLYEEHYEKMKTKKVD
jgi:hypothetical protein